MSKQTTYLTLLVFISLTILACSKHNEDDENHHHGLLQTIKNQETDSVNINIEQLMEDVRRVLAEVPEGQNQFYVLERKEMITGYPCSSCHSSTPPKLVINEENTGKKSHWDIRLEHASLDVMDCKTCHGNGNKDELLLLSGKPISFDHSYKQCAQCHSTQHKDWLGGAHGKRVVGWAAPKVVYNCTSCHNPRNPSFKPRWPARFNTVKIKERQGE